MNRIRLFIAVDTPPAIRAQAAGVRDSLRASQADVRWEPDEKLHCTLKFLGETDQEKVPAIVAALEAIGADTDAIRVRYTGLGCFPDRRDPRIIWIGLDDPDGTLKQLHDAIDVRLTPLGFEPEQRMFHAHLTLGRVKGRRNIRNLLANLETITFETEPVTIREIEMVKSELNPGGSRYTILKTIPLRA